MLSTVKSEESDNSTSSAFCVAVILVSVVIVRNARLSFNIPTLMPAPVPTLTGAPDISTVATVATVTRISESFSTVTLYVLFDSIIWLPPRLLLPHLRGVWLHHPHLPIRYRIPNVLLVLRLFGHR